MKVGGSMELLIGLVMLLVGCANLFAGYKRWGLMGWLRGTSADNAIIPTNWKPFLLVLSLLIITIGIALIFP